MANAKLIPKSATAQRVGGIALGLVCGLSVALIIWLDVSSGIWQELVILSGLAAGFVTFVLTVFVLDKVLARSTARRWTPVNRLAFTEFLHALADDSHSEISRGLVVTRSLRQPEFPADAVAHTAELEQLRDQVLTERQLLADLLSRWAPFLASSGDNETVLQHIADIALAFDRVRDAALDAESGHDRGRHANVRDEVEACNTTLNLLVAELQNRLAVT